MSRIMICGLNGSGKTTLGKELSKRINFLHKDIEEYYFNNDTDYKYNSSATKEDVTQKIEKDINEYHIYNSEIEYSKMEIYLKEKTNFSIRFIRETSLT